MVMLFTSETLRWEMRNELITGDEVVAVHTFQGYLGENA